MRTILVHQPIAIGHVAEDVKSLVTDKNLAILRGELLPGTTPFLSIQELIGNPDDCLSDHVCVMLAESGVLNRTPVMDDNGRQAKIKLDAEVLLWSYAWGSESLSTLSQEKLSALAWDLHQHEHFVHVSIVNEPEVVAEPSDNSNKELATATH